MTSELRTKKGASSLPRMASASFSGPAVPRGSLSMEKVILSCISVRTVAVVRNVPHIHI